MHAANLLAPCLLSNMTVGRNDPCPCGSGKKYKRCHGALTIATDPKRTRAAELKAVDKDLTARLLGRNSGHVLAR